MRRSALWVSLDPFGLGRQKPHHFLEIAKVAWANRDQLPYALRILNNGTCDGCALGTSGLSDWTMPGMHLCMVRLELMRLNTAPALDPARLTDVGALQGRSSAELRAFGRLAEPMLRRRGERGFTVVSWEEALDLAARRLRETDPARAAFYLTSRGITNEVYYAAQKAARFLGTNHVDNSARLCHAASTTAMKHSLGHGACTGSYRDWLHADLIVFFGSNTPNNQPVTAKYLYYARRNGARVAVVNTLREPGLAHYWVPSVADSALFGTKVADDWFDVHTGGDLAFLVGVLRALLDRPDGRGVDEAFVEAHTTGFEEACAVARAADWAALETESGSTRERMEAFADLLVEHPNAVFVWSMGLTQHVHGVDTIQALLNVGLARGLTGRPNRGLVPIRGHSGVQGGAEVGCVPGVSPDAAARWGQVWGFPVPAMHGWTTVEMIEAAARGDVDAFWIVGGNFLETVPDEARNREALQRPRFRLHQDIVLSSAMLIDPSDEVLLLPAVTRYESPGGGTETSTERRIIFSPEVPGRRIGSAKPEWWVFGEVMARVRPDEADRIRFADAAAIRQEIARAIPLYAGIERLARKGDQVQWGGPTLYEDGRFATPDGRARFRATPPGRVTRVPGTFAVSTRRGKQFNSMVQRAVDPLTGAGRDAVFMSEEDAGHLGLRDGSPVTLVSGRHRYRGHVKIAPIRSGNLEVHWPEGMSLLSDAIDPGSLEPDYNARVTVEVS